MDKFLGQLLAISLISGVIYYGLGQMIAPDYWYHHYYYLVGLFFIITVLFHLGLTKSHEKGSKEFIRYYMGATGAKLFVYLMIIIIYAFINKPGAMPFALAFFFFYLFFTAFEVSVSYTKFRKPSENEQNAKNVSSPEN